MSPPIELLLFSYLGLVQLFATPWTAACRTSLSCIVSPILLKIMSIVSMMPSNHLISSRPLSPPALILPSISVFSNESALRTSWPKFWNFSFKISSSNEYSGLISFRIYWFDLFAVQGTLKGLLQHHNSKASILEAQPSLQSNSHICT